MNTPSTEDLGFTYRVFKQGGVCVYHYGRLAATLRGSAALDFLAEVENSAEGAQQQLMARITGNYKRGNERNAQNHPRNRR